MFNPAVVRDEHGVFWMIERAAAKLQPFQSMFGLLRSDDGVKWEHVSSEPVLRGADLGYPDGSLQDPRIVRLDGSYLMVAVLRPYTWDCLPNGTGVPNYREVAYPGRDKSEPNLSRSFVATSPDLRTWNFIGWSSDITRDDRNNVPFPEKIGGRYALLRRPLDRVGPDYGLTGPGIWFNTSADLKDWDAPRLVCGPRGGWESTKLGGSAPPVRTPQGWLALYHAVDEHDVYRVGALLLDLDDPSKVLARSARPLMEPREYYERSGLVIPNTIFPAGNVVVDDELWVYYGACDTAICLAAAKITDIIAALE